MRKERDVQAPASAGVKSRTTALPQSPAPQEVARLVINKANETGVRIKSVRAKEPKQIALKPNIPFSGY